MGKGKSKAISEDSLVRMVDTYAVSSKYSLFTKSFVEDSGAEVERRPLVSKVPGSSPVLSRP